MPIKKIVGRYMEEYETRPLVDQGSDFGIAIFKQKISSTLKSVKIV